jgi:hypothetical protein
MSNSAHSSIQKGRFLVTAKSMALALCLCLTGAATAQAATAFWMGNSFSMNLPQVLNSMWPYAAPAFSLSVKEQFSAGQTLQSAWDTYKVNDSITGSHFDFVIMQSFVWGGDGGGLGGAFVRDSAYAVRIVPLARDNGAEPILEVTQLGQAATVQDWSDQCRLFDSLGSQLHIRIIPIAHVWRRALDTWPGLSALSSRLWRPSDGVHQDRYGEALNAYTFYGFFTGQSPVGHPYTGGIAADTVLLLQTTAWEVLQERNSSVPVTGSAAPRRNAGSQGTPCRAYTGRSASRWQTHQFYQLNGMSVPNSAFRNLAGSVLVDKQARNY